MFILERTLLEAFPLVEGFDKDIVLFNKRFEKIFHEKFQALLVEELLPFEEVWWKLKFVGADELQDCFLGGIFLNLC